MFLIFFSDASTQDEEEEELPELLIVDEHPQRKKTPSNMNPNTNTNRLRTTRRGRGGVRGGRGRTGRGAERDAAAIVVEAGDQSPTNRLLFNLIIIIIVIY